MHEIKYESPWDTVLSFVVLMEQSLIFHLNIYALAKSSTNCRPENVLSYDLSYFFTMNFMTAEPSRCQSLPSFWYFIMSLIHSSASNNPSKELFNISGSSSRFRSFS